ncbi:MAG: putative bifunctional diguanylate cyclase/phosphodiesterase [Pontibacterium sp.]
MLLVLVLFFVHSSYSFIAFRQQEQQFQDERERLNHRDIAVLEGLVDSSYQRLLELGEILPLLIAEQDAAEPDHLMALSQTINLNFDRFSLNGSLDSIYLYDQRARLIEGRGMTIALPQSVVRNVLVTEKPARNLYCSVDCLRYVALPIQFGGNNTGVMVVGRTLIDVVLSFNRQRARDIGLAFRMPSASSELPEWGLSLKYLTQKGQNIQVLQKLVAQYPYSPEGGVYQVEHEGRAYEVVLKVPEGVQNDVAFWVLVEDLTQDRQLMYRKFFSSLALAAGGLLVAAVLQLSVLRRPMNRLSRIARQLPKLAESSYEDVRTSMRPRGLRRRRYYDEMDVLSNSTLNLTDQLQRLEISVQERTQKLKDHSSALEQERDFVNSLLDTAQAIILTQDQNGVLITVNSCGQRLLGITEPQLGVLRFESLKHTEESWKEHSKQLALIESGRDSQAQGETRIIGADDETRDIAWMHSRLNSPSGENPGLLTVGIDITERKQAERRLFWLANHDPLTSLPNRTLFNHRLSEAIENAQRIETQVAVLFCDLDGFKDVNDSMGHVVGDELLKQAAKRFNTLLGDGDMLSRMSSDEFMVLKDKFRNPRTIEAYAERILEAFRQPFRIDGFEIFTTISVGIAIFPDHGNDAITLVKNADIAIFQAKEDGKNRWRIFNQVLGVERDERFSLVNDLRKAMANEELHLHYQPQIDSLTGRLIGVEALLRWNHPVAGMISPAKFIPLAEEQGLIIPIGEWVLREACYQMKSWQDKGLHGVRVGVNLAGQQLMHERLLFMVDDILQETRLEPCYLDLEVTENFLIRQPELLVPKLHKLREKGVSLSMDDFGTGFSSLSYLKKLPVDTLKIDQSFVRDIGKNQDDEAIVKAIIVLCQSLGIQVLAEGVETKPQLSFLQEHGCALIQGYYFSKPLPPKEVLAFADSLKKQAVSV